MDFNSIPNRASDAGPERRPFKPTPEELQAQEEYALANIDLCAGPVDDQYAKDWNEEMAADAAQEND